LTHSVDQDLSSDSPRFLYPSVYVTGLVSLGAVAFNLHVLLHLSIVGFASFLAVVSLTSYLRVARAKLLFIALAFILFAAQEFVILAQVVSIIPADILLFVGGSQLEIGHVLTLLTLGLFSGGLFRNN